MPDVLISPLQKLRFCDSNGNPLNGGKLFTYDAGTTNKRNTYTDATGATPNQNPIILDTRGECNCWMTPGISYKFTLSPSTDTDPPTAAIWTVDGVAGSSTSTEDQNESFHWCGAAGGTANIMTLTPVGGIPAAYAAGQRFSFLSLGANTGATTVNVGGRGPKNLFSNGIACVGGEISGANLLCQIIYDGTQFHLMSVNANMLAYVQNALTNGGMEIWQRGQWNTATLTVAASSNGYGPDRWALTTGANQACTMSEVSGIATGSLSSAQVARNVGQTGTGAIYFEHPFEIADIALWRSKVMQLSFTLSTGAGWSPTNGTINVNLYCGTGTNARRGSAAYTAETTPLTTSFNVPAGTGATQYKASATVIVPANTAQMSLSFSWAPAGTAVAFDHFTIDDVMLSATNGAAYERLTFTEEYARCQRWYCKSYSIAVAPGAATIAGLVFSATNTLTTAAVCSYNVSFPVEMRAAPTVAFYDAAGNALKMTAFDTGSFVQTDNVAQTLYSNPSTRQLSMYSTVSASSTFAVHFTANASL
jgi:hypothetical protein